MARPAKARRVIVRHLSRPLVALRYRHVAAQPKVFGIGLSRTGTTSLTRGLEQLGYRCCHFPDFMLKLEDDGLRPVPGAIKYYQALTDTPVAAFYRQLDEYFPGSRFILTLRDTDAWLESCRRFFRSGRWRHKPKVLALHRLLYGSAEFEADRFARSYQAHVDGIRQYFAGRENDLLELDLTAGEGFEKLNPFLGLPATNEEFPKLHASQKR